METIKKFRGQRVINFKLKTRMYLTGMQPDLIQSLTRDRVVKMQIKLTEC